VLCYQGDFYQKYTSLLTGFFKNISTQLYFAVNACKDRMYIPATECVTDLYKAQLAQNWLWWFDFRLKQIFNTDPAASKIL